MPSTIELPVIVWETIFEYVLYSGGRRSVLPLMFACKSWKASALPLLYREAEVRDAGTLENYALRLMQIEMTGVDPSLWMHTLAVRTPQDAVAWDARMISAFLLLLPRLKGLLELVAWPSLMPPQVLDGLSRQTQHILTRLVFAMSGNRTLGPRLHMLNTFTTLRYLKMRMCRGSEHVLETAMIQGLDIPSLVDLHWITDDPKNERALVFLSQSHFASLQVLTLELDALSMKKRSVLPFHPFFASHRDLKTATIYASDDVMEQLFLCGLRATDMVFDRVPSTFVVTMSGSYLRSFSVILDVSSGNDQSHRLRELVKFLLRSGETSLEEIRLKSPPRRPRWQWNRLPALALENDTASKQVGLLVAASVQLEKRGIQLLDADRKRAVTMWE